MPLAQLVEHQIKSPSVNYTSHYDDEEKGGKIIMRRMNFEDLKKVTLEWADDKDL